MPSAMYRHFGKLRQEALKGDCRLTTVTRTCLTRKKKNERHLKQCLGRKDSCPTGIKGVCLKGFIRKAMGKHLSSFLNLHYTSVQKVRCIEFIIIQRLSSLMILIYIYIFF